MGKCSVGTLPYDITFVPNEYSLSTGIQDLSLFMLGTLKEEAGHPRINVNCPLLSECLLGSKV